MHHFGGTSISAHSISLYQLHVVAITLILNPLSYALIRKHYRRAYWFVLRHPMILCNVTSNGEFDFGKLFYPIFSRSKASCGIFPSSVIGSLVTHSMQSRPLVSHLHFFRNAWVLPVWPVSRRVFCFSYVIDYYVIYYIGVWHYHAMAAIKTRVDQTISFLPPIMAAITSWCKASTAF